MPKRRDASYTTTLSLAAPRTLRNRPPSTPRSIFQPKTWVTSPARVTTVRLARGVAPSVDCFLHLSFAPKKSFFPNRRRSTAFLARASPRVRVPGARHSTRARSPERDGQARSAPLASRGSRRPRLSHVPKKAFSTFASLTRTRSTSSLAPLLPYAPSVKYNTDHNIHVRSPDDLDEPRRGALAPLVRGHREAPRLHRRVPRQAKHRPQQPEDDLGKLYAVDNNVAHDIEDRGMSALI